MAKTVVISDNSVNGYGFRILTDGIDITQYERNPILLFMHNRPMRGNKEDILAIGIVVNLRKDGEQLLGDLEFDQSDEYAKTIEAKWDAKVYRMVSPGLEPIEWSDDVAYLLPGQTRSSVIKSKLQEISVVDIAGNDNALALYKEGKLIKLSDAENNDFIPEINQSNHLKTEITNMKTIALKLGLAETATEQDILNKISELQTSSNQSVELSAQIATITLAGITAMVDQAIVDKKITADKKETFITLGKTTSAEILKETLGCIPTQVKPIELLMNKGSNGTSSDKKFSEIGEKELITMRADDRPEYIRLYKAEYGLEPKFDEAK